MKKTESIVFVVMCLLMVFTTGCSTLHKAADNGDLATIKQCLQEGADVNTKEYGETPLMSAVYHAPPVWWWLEPIIPRLDIVQYLVDKGADVNARDNNGWTPLMWALCTPYRISDKTNQMDIVQYLVDKGADVNARNKYGETPIYMRAFARNPKMAKILVDKGADVNARDERGRTPMMWAAVFGDLEMVKFLVDKGADVNARDKDGYTPLKYITGMGYNPGFLNTDQYFDGSRERKRVVAEFLKQHGAKE